MSNVTLILAQVKAFSEILAQVKALSEQKQQGIINSIRRMSCFRFSNYPSSQRD